MLGTEKIADYEPRDFFPTRIVVKEQLKLCFHSSKYRSPLYIKEMISGVEKFTSMAIYCKSCHALYISPELKQKDEPKGTISQDKLVDLKSTIYPWKLKNEVIEKISRFKIRDLKSRIIGFGFSIFSLGFLCYLLIGVINHHFK